MSDVSRYVYRQEGTGNDIRHPVPQTRDSSRDRHPAFSSPCSDLRIDPSIHQKVRPTALFPSAPSSESGSPVLVTMFFQTSRHPHRTTCVTIQKERSYAKARPRYSHPKIPSPRLFFANNRVGPSTQQGRPEGPNRTPAPANFPPSRPSNHMGRSLIG